MADQQKKILIIEDEVVLSKPLKENLAHEGFDVTLAEDGEKGFAAAITLQPDLILLNLRLPKMDGMTVLRKLREENSWGRAVSVIILTNLSSTDEQIMNDLTELTPTYYFEKIDWKIKDVIEKVKEILAERDRVK